MMLAMKQLCFSLVAGYTGIASDVSGLDADRQALVPVAKNPADRNEQKSDARNRDPFHATLARTTGLGLYGSVSRNRNNACDIKLQKPGNKGF
jgi:hypothetical protein